MKKSFSTILFLLLCTMWYSCKKEETTNYRTASPAPVVNTPVLPPNVFAGVDIWVSLPVNSATLSGSVSNASGAPFRFLWRQISGPSIVTITQKDSLKTDIAGLVKGDYTFEFLVTNVYNMSGRDTIAVYVQEKQEPADTELYFMNLSWICPFGCSVTIDCFSCHVPTGKPFKIYILDRPSGRWNEVAHIDGNYFFDNYYYNVKGDKLLLYADNTSLDTVDVKIKF